MLYIIYVLLMVCEDMSNYRNKSNKGVTFIYKMDKILYD